MDKHRRMTRMLGALVASMTVGALCLDWMQPVRTTAPPAPGIELMARGPSSDQIWWKGIQIEARAQNASPHLENFHFIVYRNGNTVQTDNWSSKRILGGSPVVQVMLLMAPGPQGVTSTQRSAARDLVHRLQRDYAIPSDRISGADKLNRGTLSQSSSEPEQWLASAGQE